MKLLNAWTANHRISTINDVSLRPHRLILGWTCCCGSLCKKHISIICPEGIFKLTRQKARHQWQSLQSIFGCIAYAHIPDSQRRKLDKKAKKYRFVGYCKNSKGYRLVNEETRKIVRRRDVIFNETNFDMKSTSSPQMIVELNLIETDRSDCSPRRCCWGNTATKRTSIWKHELGDYQWGMWFWRICGWCCRHGPCSISRISDHRLNLNIDHRWKTILGTWSLQGKNTRRTVYNRFIKRVCPEVRDRLWRNLLPCCTVLIHKNTIGLCSTKWYANSSNGCGNSIFTWRA